MRSTKFLNPFRCFVFVIIELLFLWLVLGGTEVYAEQDAGVTSKPAESSAVVFDVWEFRVEGNTLLDSDLIERTLLRFTGPNKTLEDVEAARKNLELEYHNAGYPTVLVNIPQQDVKFGVVRLSVTEGRIESMRITGSRYFSPQRMREMLSTTVGEGGVPNFPKLQENLENLNIASADRSVVPVLRPGRTPGTVEMELKVTDHPPLHGKLEVNDRRTEGTTRTRLNASVSYDNLWQREHSISFQYFVSPEDRDEVEGYAGTYLMPLQSPRHLLAVYGVHSDTNTSDNSVDIGNLLVVGGGDIAGMRYILPLTTTFDNFQQLSMGFDYKDFNENVNTKADDASVSKTPIDYVGFSLRLASSSSEARIRTQGNIESVFGVRGLVNEEDEFTKKRQGAQPNFFYLRGDLTHERPLWRGWTLHVNSSMQLSREPLISNEQFSAGGADSVRGYYASQVLGDSGLQGSLEVHTPNLAQSIESIDDLQFLVFADAAYVWREDPLPGEPKDFRLAGEGVGLRANAWKRFGLTLDVAYPSKDEGDVDQGDWRAHFQFDYTF